MRIAHFGFPGTADEANGVHRAIHGLSVTQVAMGDDVAVFGVSARLPAPIDGVTIRVYPPERVPFRVPRALLDDLRGWEPDVVHLHSVYVPAHVALVAHLRAWGVPYVVTPHGGLSPHVMRRRTYLKWPYRLLCQLPILNGAAFVHAVADDDHIRAYGVTVPIVVAPNGLYLESIPRDLRQDAIASRFPAVAGRKCFVFVGRLDPFYKGLDLLLEAFARALEREREIVLVLVGPDHGSGGRFLRRLAVRLGVEDRALFWGPAYGREKYEVVCSADVFVHPSRSEGGFPSAVMEALACGRPCLVTRAVDRMGLIPAYDAGCSVEPTVSSIEDALLRFASESRRTLDEQGRRGQWLVAQELTWRPTAETLHAAYARYAGRRVAPPAPVPGAAGVQERRARR